MPNRESFDPETLDILDEALRGACADLGVSDNTPHSREHVARTVLQLADGQRDPQSIRKSVVTFLKAQHSGGSTLRTIGGSRIDTDAFVGTSFGTLRPLSNL